MRSSCGIAAIVGALACAASADGAMVWDASGDAFAPAFSLTGIAGGVGLAVDELTILDWGDLPADTVVQSARVSYCSPFAGAQVQDFDLHLTLYDGDDGNNSSGRVELASTTAESLPGLADGGLCNTMILTIVFDPPIELGDTNGQPEVPGAVFNAMSFADLDGDGLHDFSYSFRFDVPVGTTEPLFLVAGSPDAPGATPQADVFGPAGYIETIGADQVFLQLLGVDAGGGCNTADLAEPFGVLDLADIQNFVDGFLNADPIADIAAPDGVLDLADVQAFTSAFTAGCP